MYKKIKQLGTKIIRTVPHYRFQTKIKLTELLGDLCLIRSELNVELSEYSFEVTNLSNVYGSIVHTGPVMKTNIYRLNALLKKVKENYERVNFLIVMNKSTIQRITKLDDVDYINNPDVEKGISSSILKAKIINKEFESLSDKITNLSLKETP